MASNNKTLDLSVWTVASAATLAVLVAFQGGYYPAPIGLATIALSLLAIARVLGRCAQKKRPTISKTSSSRIRASVPRSKMLALSAAFAICLLAWCAARPFLDGIASYETLSAISRPALAIATAAYWLQLSQDEKHSAIKLVAYEGVLFSVVALLMFAGVLPYPGAVVDGRLQFTFHTPTRQEPTSR